MSVPHDLPLRFRSLELPVEHVEDARLRALVTYWHHKCAGRRMPARREIEPADFRDLMGRILLLDVLRDPLRFRFRLVGTLLVEAIGFDPTGKLTTEAGPRGYLDEVEGHYRAVVERRAPIYHRITFDWVSTEMGVPATLQRDYVRLLLPLADDGENVDMILAASVSDASWGLAWRKATGTER
ncbi:PAS domain-containing protein [Desertibaculum subflavum]|uniref:PAS domain-containing protein n=1 Tax=Desertibaculum subflavum TaxID=2268458 RepID=UPI000E6639F9